MANFFPPGFVFPPPPPWWAVPPPPPPPWRSTSYTDDSSSTHGGIIAAVSMVVAMIFLFVVCIYSIAGRPPAPPVAEPREDNDDEEQQLRSAAAGERGEDSQRPRRASPTTAGLPSFTYSLSLKHNVTGTGDGDEPATCSVCLGALEVGETVRQLPVCMHLYHVECIDPWLDAHSTCPICRSGTMEEGLLPPV